MSLWWFEQLADLVPNHVVSTDVPAEVRGRAVVCERLEMFPVECVARGYLTGSGLLDYRATGEVCGIALPAGLEDGSRLPEPIFTPATKADARRARRERVVRRGGARPSAPTRPRELRDLTLDVYAPGRGDRPRARHHPGRHQARVRRRRATARPCSADEVLTPDSSRFWPAAEWQPGRTQPSYDKQIVRNWLLSPESGWDRASGEPPPPLPDEVVERDPRAVRRGLRDCSPARRSEPVRRPRSPSPRRREVAFDYLVDPRNRPGVAVLAAARLGGGRRRAAASARPGST